MVGARGGVWTPSNGFTLSRAPTHAPRYYMRPAPLIPSSRIPTPRSSSSCIRWSTSPWRRRTSSSPSKTTSWRPCSSCAATGRHVPVCVCQWKQVWPRSQSYFGPGNPLPVTALTPSSLSNHTTNHAGMRRPRLPPAAALRARGGRRCRPPWFGGGGRRRQAQEGPLHRPHDEGTCDT